MALVLKTMAKVVAQGHSAGINLERFLLLRILNFIREVNGARLSGLFLSCLFIFLTSCLLLILVSVLLILLLVLITRFPTLLIDINSC